MDTQSNLEKNTAKNILPVQKQKHRPKGTLGNLRNKGIYALTYFKMKFTVK